MSGFSFLYLHKGHISGNLPTGGKEKFYELLVSKDFHVQGRTPREASQPVDHPHPELNAPSGTFLLCGN